MAATALAAKALPGAAAAAGMTKKRVSKSEREKGNNNHQFQSVVGGVDFFEQAVGVSPLVDHEEHVAYVYADASCELCVEEDV